MKIRKLWLILLLTLTACGGNNTSSSNNNGNNEDVIINYDGSKDASGDQFDFPGNYTPPELTIDGLRNEKEWNNGSEIITFGSLNQCSAQLYRGEKSLFCFFEVVDSDIQTVGNNNGDDVTKGDSIEIYFDFKDDAANKPQNDDIQINIGAHGKTRIFVGSNGEWGSWNGLLDYEIVLNGTLNDSLDEDNGYTVELMIPYAQVGIDKNSTYGVAFGHVARGKDSTHESLEYTWGGLTYEGSFVDPQVPKSYIVSMGNKFYSRANVPIGNIEVNGTVYDENGSPLGGVKVQLGELETTTNNDGKYEFLTVSGDKGYELKISKDGYDTFTTNILVSELKTDTGRVTFNYCLIKTGSNKITKIKGVVKNPVEGEIGNVKVKVGENETLTDNNGTFEIDALVQNDLYIVLEKDNFKTSSAKLNTLDLARNTTLDIGVLSLYSPSSTAKFGGARGIPAAEVEIFRGFEGINFVFKTSVNITNGDHIELFIDAKGSFYGRDKTDYRIDLNGDGGVNSYYWSGSYTNTPSKGITNNAYLEGVTYYMEVMVPYSFLDVSEKDVIGVSFGVWSESLREWDGWDFIGYDAHEYSSEYCRVGLDNGLYRASSNEVTMNKVYGYVLDASSNPIIDASVNGISINNDGSYSIYFEKDVAATLTFAATGYLTQTFELTKEELNVGLVKLDVTLVLARATISGTCNVDGVKVYLESDPSICTYVENGTYSIDVPTDKNAFLVFEKEGYKKVRKGFGVASLVGAASQNSVITFNVVMEAE